MNVSGPHLRADKPARPALYFALLYALLCALGLAAPRCVRAQVNGYNGDLDGANLYQFYGWASDPNYQVGTVSLYDGATLLGTALANQYRGDLAAGGFSNPYLGFTFLQTGFLRDGKPHTIHAYLNGLSFELYQSPRSITVPAAPNGQYGYLDRVDDYSIAGWAWDQAQPNVALPTGVDLFDGTTYLATIPANQYRGDLAAGGYGNGYHGASLPTPFWFKDGNRHTIHAYIGGTCTELYSSPLTYVYSRPALPSNGAMAIPNSGFEVQVQGAGNATYQPANCGWTFTGSAGMAGNGSVFNNTSNAPEGVQVAFVQGGGSFSQPIYGFASGTFTLNVYAAQRNYNGINNQTVAVQIDGQTVGTFTPTDTTFRYYRLTFPVSSHGAGVHTLGFAGMNATGDNTALLDSVYLSGPHF